MSSAPIQRIANRLDLDERIAPFADRVWRPGSGNAAVLNLEVVSAIPFLVDIDGVEEYQHRARIRAADDDMYATVTASAPRCEAYSRNRLDSVSRSILPLSRASMLARWG